MKITMDITTKTLTNKFRKEVCKMKFSEDYMIREWQGRLHEVNDFIYDINHKMDYYIMNEDCRLASILSEYRHKLYERKRMIERYLDEKGPNLY